MFNNECGGTFIEMFLTPTLHVLSTIYGFTVSEE